MNQGVNAINGIMTMLEMIASGAICDLRSELSNFLYLRKGLRFLTNALKKIKKAGTKKLAIRIYCKITTM